MPDLITAVAAGDVRAVQRLLSEAASSPALVNQVDSSGKCALHYACQNGDVRVLSLLLDSAHTELLLTCPDGNTALHLAALSSSRDIISLLYADGRSNLDYKNKFGETPLHLVAAQGNTVAAETAALLLHLGAHLSIVDKWGRTPFDVSREHGEAHITVVFETYLQDDKACTLEEREMVNLCTAKYQAKCAAESIQRDNARSLLVIPSVSDIRLKPTKTICKNIFNDSTIITQQLSSAYSSGHKKALSKLVEYPGSLEQMRALLLDVDEVDPAGADAFGLTALHKFSAWNKCEYIELLIPHLSTVDIQRRCPAGKTALDHAVDAGAQDAVKMLTAVGVNENGNTQTILIINLRGQEVEIAFDETLTVHSLRERFSSSDRVFFGLKALDESIPVHLQGIRPGYTLRLLPSENFIEEKIRSIPSSDKYLLKRGIISFDMASLFGEAKSEHFMSTLYDRANTQIQRSPNTLHAYGSNDVISGDELRLLLTRINPFIYEYYGIAPSIELRLFTDFSIHYSADRDIRLQRHTDDSDITINICLFNTLESDGCLLKFCGILDTPFTLSDPGKDTLFQFRRGIMLVHRGSNIHETTPLENAVGERCNLVIWLKFWDPGLNVLY